MNTHNFKRIAIRAFVGVLSYAIVWAVVFGVCFLINKAVGSDATGNVLQVAKYAGYPLLAIGWVLGWLALGVIWVVCQIFVGAAHLLRITFPYCLYVIGIPLALFTLYKVVTHLGSNPGPTAEERAAEARHQERMRAVKEGLLLRSISGMTRD